VSPAGGIYSLESDLRMKNTVEHPPSINGPYDDQKLWPDLNNKSRASNRSKLEDSKNKSLVSTEVGSGIDIKKTNK